MVYLFSNANVHFVFLYLLRLDLTTSKCVTFISEINANNPPKFDDKEFIELEFTCSENDDIPSAIGTKILIVNGIAARHKPSVTFYANLVEFTGNERQFYVVGSTSLPNVNMEFTHEKIKSSRKTILRGQTTFFDMIPNAAPYPEAIILLQIHGKPADDLDRKIVFSNIRNYVPFDDEFIKFVKPYIIDIVVYTRKTGFSR